MMPKFFLCERNDMDVADQDGLELPDVASARTVASGRLALDQTPCLDARRIDIEDEQGRVIDTVWLRDVVQIDS
jgi:hypothetical protein